ncbi:MAG: flagellar assembly protein FliW [Deltaproteobacteria bacterium]|nr:flagellar assembly protein FliW [Deltaproteobacteria bacterium]
MIIQTRLFGEIEIEEEKLLTFPSGLVGMPHLKRFILLDREEDSPFRWMQSLNDPSIAFLTLEPQVFRSDYHVMVQQEEVAHLGITEETETLVLCIVTLYREPKTLTANLQGPLVINVEKRQGKQVILLENQYTPRHDILQEIGHGRGDRHGEPEGNVLELKQGR